MSEINSETKESKKEQMNLNVHEDTTSVIAEEAQKRYGSKKKMGQALDEIVREWAGTDDTEVLDRLDKIEEMLEGEVSSDTHTGGKTHSTGVSDELLEAIESGTVNPSEHDLTQLKGEDGVLVRDAIIGVLRHRGEVSYSKKEIQMLVETEFGYSVNAARSKRDAVLNQLVDVDVNIESEIEGWLEEEYEAGLHHEPQGSAKYTAETLDAFKRKFGSLGDYIGVELRGDGYVLPEQADKVRSIRETQLNYNMTKAVENRNRHLVWRVQQVADELGVELETQADFDADDI